MEMTKLPRSFQLQMLEGDLLSLEMPEDIKNISCPFRCKGDPAGCGDPNLELSCQSNKPVIEVRSGKYYVKRISYDEQVIILVDVNLANGSCALPYKPLSTDEVYYPTLYSYYQAPGRTILSARFLNCSENITDPSYARAPCLSGNQSHVYITTHGSYISDFPMSCSLLSVVPIQFPSDVGETTYPSYETIRKFLQSGFDLQLLVMCKDGADTRPSVHCANDDDGMLPSCNSFPFYCVGFICIRLQLLFLLNDYDDIP
ncbi:hypothetical protein Pint_22157 [Pistacia integerrima]|uniref:Uncharacterized protein n=1 Tax=Pistacia integerrima TaxID=434235 RepID=A0ACC0YNN4_9ROSI|nr:hypothetical protein Pint_22157 [Pistacia integerrima]